MATGEQTKTEARWLPRILLAVWAAFLLLSILADSVPQGQWQVGPFSAKLAAYEKVLEPTSRLFPGYPFFMLDAVRSLLNPLMHMTRWAFLGATFFFLLVFLASVYAATVRLAGEWLGLFAAVMASTVPFVMTAARVYDTHMPRLAAIALTLAVLQRFAIKHRLFDAALLIGAFLFGAIVCSGSTDYLFYGLALAGPLAAVFIAGVRRTGQRRLFVAVGAILLIAIGIISPIWLRTSPFPGWLSGEQRIFTDLSSLFNDPRSIFHQPIAALAYLDVLAGSMLSLLHGPLFLVGFIFFCLRKDSGKWQWIAGVAVFFVGVVLLPKRNMYYIANMLPALSVAAGVGLGELLKRWNNKALIGALALIVAVHLSYLFGWLHPGTVTQDLRRYFVPGLPQYSPRIDSVGLEPFGTPVLNEDRTAIELQRLLANSPRPLSIGFIGCPCLQERFVVELAYRGIYARDVLCSPLPPDAAPYDAIVLLPRLQAIDGVSKSESLIEIHSRLTEVTEQNGNLFTILAPLGKGSDEAQNKLQKILTEAEPEMTRLTARYTKYEHFGDFLFFIDPDAAHRIVVSE